MTGALKFCIPALLMTSCGTEPFAPGATEQAESIGNPVSMADLAGSTLTTTRLDASRAAAMGTTAAGRRVLGAAVRCALGSTQAIAFSVAGVSYTASGGIGLAPGWTAAALTATQASWVSACLFAHMNDATGLIWISVRGNVSTLAPTTIESTGYRVEEGAFWGNAFADRGTVAAYSCLGADQAIDDSYGDLPQRRCAHWDGSVSSTTSACGMHYAGACRSACSSQTAPYSDCTFQGSAAAKQVTTIFLAGALSP